jgi:dephospho-CoA kinase
MTPKGISFIKKSDREKSIIIYIEADEETRRSRLLERRDADDVERRIKADEEDFKDFEDFDLVIKNSENELPSVDSFLSSLKG